MRVLLADKLPDAARLRLAASGCEVIVDAALSGDALTAALTEHDPDVLVVRSTKVLAQHMAAGRNLSLVVRAGAGVNTIDLEAAGGRGIYVANCPGKNADAVAELAMGLMVALDRQLVEGANDLRDGKWDKGRYSKAIGIKGRTLGIIGCGTIGSEVARRANAFGMKVIGWSRSLTIDRAALMGVEFVSDPLEVATRADVLSVHLAASPETTGFVSEAMFNAMQPGSIFLNTSRSEVVDSEALLKALNTRGLKAGLDVFPDEPAGKTGTFEHALAQHRSVVGSHHIGASTQQAQDAVADEACRVVEVFAATGRAPNCVNMAIESTADHVLVVRHADKVGVLASVLEVLREANLNIQEMENQVFAGGKAAVARISVLGKPSVQVFDRLHASEMIFAVSAVPVRHRR